MATKVGIEALSAQVVRKVRKIKAETGKVAGQISVPRALFYGCGPILNKAYIFEPALPHDVAT